MSEPLIELKDITKVYQSPVSRKSAKAGLEAPEVTALERVTLDFQPGEFTAIAGPSGSGKSTLLNLIGTIDTPTSGEIRFKGRAVTHLSEDQLADFRLREMGFVFQAYNLIPVLTAAENVEYPLALQKVAREERRARALEALAWVGLEGLEDRRPDLLSGGQQQRVAVARAMVHRPSVVLADEPTANLDSKTAGSLLDMMLRLNAEHKITFLFSSHDPTVLSRARRILRLHDGRLQNGDA